MILITTAIIFLNDNYQYLQKITRKYILISQKKITNYNYLLNLHLHIVVDKYCILHFLFYFDFLNYLYSYEFHFLLLIFLDIILNSQPILLQIAINDIHLIHRSCYSYLQCNPLKQYLKRNVLRCSFQYWSVIKHSHLISA